MKKLSYLSISGLGREAVDSRLLATEFRLDARPRVLSASLLYRWLAVEESEALLLLRDGGSGGFWAPLYDSDAWLEAREEARRGDLSGEPIGEAPFSACSSSTENKIIEFMKK